MTIHEQEGNRALLPDRSRHSEAQLQNQLRDASVTGKRSSCDTEVRCPRNKVVSYRTDIPDDTDLIELTRYKLRVVKRVEKLRQKIYTGALGYCNMLSQCYVPVVDGWRCKGVAG